jgi:hypothetical protein
VKLGSEAARNGGLVRSVNFPHALNLAKLGSEVDINGGLAKVSDLPFRVCQKQEFLFYGAEISIAKINLLTEEEYEEEKIQHAFQDRGELGIGSHTLNISKNCIVTDFVIFENY